VQLKKPKPLRARIPRRRASREGLHADDSSHLWAISYADFLMVLLSFFVIFFSADDKKRENMIFQIVSELKIPHVQVAGGGVGRAITSIGSDNLSDSLSAQLRKALSGRKVEINEGRDSVTINLPDDIYTVGGVNLNEESEATLLEILEKVQPDIQSVVIGFIGHTDSIPVDGSKHKVLNTNMDISVVRASKALMMGASFGLPVDHMYASGAAQNIRSTRSLSVVIKSAAGGLM